MVKVQRELRFADAFDKGRIEPKNFIIGDVLVIERRQNERPCKAELPSAMREKRGVVERARSRADHDARHRNVTVRNGFHNGQALRNGKRHRLTRRSEQVYAVTAVAEQPQAMAQQRRNVWPQAAKKRSNRGSNDASEAKRLMQQSSQLRVLCRDKQSWESCR